MNAPTLRSVAVAAGFLGVTMVVAGAATAMTAQPSDEPVATAVTIEHDEAESATTVGSAGEAPAATAVEVPAAPIECTPEGQCGAEEQDTSTVANAVAPAEPEPAAAAPSESASAPATCDLPARPDRPEDGDRDAWKQSMGAWIDDVKATARDCGLERSQWRAALGDGAWKDLESWHKERHDDSWTADRKDDRASRDGHRSRWSGHHDDDGDRAESSDKEWRDGEHRWDGDREWDRDHDGHHDGDRQWDGSRDGSDGWGDRDR